MPVIATTKINNPKKPGEFLIINASDFDPAVHTPWKGAVVIDVPVVTLPEPRGNDLSGYVPPVGDERPSTRRRGR